MGHGFVTPSALHYVRNHGPVPRLTWDEHKVTITGLVNQTRTFSMDEIAAMPQVLFGSETAFVSPAFYISFYFLNDILLFCGLGRIQAHEQHVGDTLY